MATVAAPHVGPAIAGASLESVGGGSERLDELGGWSSHISIIGEKERAWRATGRQLVAQFPLVGWGDSRGARRYLGCPGLASLEVGTFCEVLCVASVAVRWPSPRAEPRSVSIPTGTASSQLPSPGPATSGFILPCRSSSSEFLRSILPLGVFRPEHAYPGFRPSSRHHRNASTGREVCHPLAMFRPQAFSASRRFAPRFGLRACFIPHATSRVVAVQGLLSPRSRTLSSSAVAPLPFSSRALTGEPAAILERLDSEAFLHARQRSLRFGVSLPASRSPPRFSVSSRSSPAAFCSGLPVTRTPALSTHGVASRALHAQLSRPPPAYVDNGLGSSVSFGTNLPETFEPSVRSLHGDPVRRGPTARLLTSSLTAVRQAQEYSYHCRARLQPRF